MVKSINSNTISGVGISARPPYYSNLTSNTQDVPWIEVLIDNFLNERSLPYEQLERLAEIYPLTFHGVNLSIGAQGDLNFDYLKKIKKFIKRFSPKYYSDHLCWTHHNAHHFHDLLPLPYNEETINHVAQKLTQAQDYLEFPIALENVSAYLKFKDSKYNEGHILRELCLKTGCQVLLDINNIFVSEWNLGYDAVEFLQEIPKNHIAYAHLAGYTVKDNYLLDTHSKPVSPSVWKLYETAIKMLGPIPTAIEWDDDHPSYDVLYNEVQQAKYILDKHTNDYETFRPSETIFTTPKPSL